MLYICVGYVYVDTYLLMYTGAPAYFIYASCRLKSGVVNRLTRHCFVCISYFYNRITVSLFVLDASVILQDLNMEDTDIFFVIVTKIDSQGGYISHSQTWYFKFCTFIDCLYGDCNCNYWSGGTPMIVAVTIGVVLLPRL